jgi:predicted metal-dependent hydrolase
MTRDVARVIQIENRTIAFTLRRSLRARWMRADLSLRAGLRVTLPAGMEESRALAFLRSRSRWLVRALGRLERLAAIIPDRTLAHGTTVPYLGRELTLNLSIGEPRVGRLGDSLIVHVRRRTRRSVERALTAWYREEALREFSERAGHLAQKHRLRYRRLRIGNQKSRWGTCTASGTVSLNWRLMLGPESVARYLIAHELSHLVEPNHSARFWAKVAELCPDYREHEAWLKRYGPGLVL